MVGAPGPPAPTPPRGPTVDFFYVDGGRSWTSSSGTSQGGPSATSSSKKKLEKHHRKKMLGPPVGSLPLPRCAQGPLSVPCRMGTPHTSSKSRQRARCALTRPHVSMTSGYATQHGQLGCCNTSRGASSRLLARGSSGAITCLVAPAPESRLGAGRVLPHVLWNQLLPPSIEQLRSHHVPRGSSSRLLA
jgi:hypothetical protein